MFIPHCKLRGPLLKFKHNLIASVQSLVIKSVHVEKNNTRNIK